MLKSSTILTVNLTLNKSVYFIITINSNIGLLHEGHYQLGWDIHYISYHLCVINKVEWVIKCCVDGGIETTNTVVEFLIGHKSKHNTDARKAIHKWYHKSKQTYNNRQTQRASRTPRMKHCKSFLSRCFCFKLPPHLPKQRQQQKQQPTMVKSRTKTGPRKVTTSNGAHHFPSYKKICTS